MVFHTKYKVAGIFVSFSIITKALYFPTHLVEGYTPSQCLCASGGQRCLRAFLSLALIFIANMFQRKCLLNLPNSCSRSFGGGRRLGLMKKKHVRQVHQPRFEARRSRQEGVDNLPREHIVILAWGIDRSGG